MFNESIYIPIETSSPRHIYCLRKGAKLSFSQSSYFFSSSNNLLFKLLLHSGILSVSSPGVFDFSPIALRAVSKLTTFIDYKMSEIGGQKCMFPTLGREQLWIRSGRWGKFGGEMFRLKDRAGRSYCLQPVKFFFTSDNCYFIQTHEEEVCNFVSGLSLNISVLPLRIYQISSKFRDEIQPKLGLLRCREFLMKGRVCILY